MSRNDGVGHAAGTILLLIFGLIFAVKGLLVMWNVLSTGTEFTFAGFVVFIIGLLFILVGFVAFDEI